MGRWGDGEPDQQLFKTFLYGYSRFPILNSQFSILNSQFPAALNNNISYCR
ncbi:MAG: hypothetical protein F6K44_18555, partial [Moorea sp. SIO3E2]|nr:hypothetical protein [Moorena sp. SIO3E2]